MAPSLLKANVPTTFWDVTRCTEIMRAQLADSNVPQRGDITAPRLRMFPSRSHSFFFKTLQLAVNCTGDTKFFIFPCNTTNARSLNGKRTNTVPLRTMVTIEWFFFVHEQVAWLRQGRPREVSMRKRRESDGSRWYSKKCGIGLSCLSDPLRHHPLPFVDYREEVPMPILCQQEFLYICFDLSSVRVKPFGPTPACNALEIFSRSANISR